MSLVSNLQTAFTRVGTEFKSIRTLISGTATGDISGLTTTDKSSLVAAVNEVKAGATGSPPAASETVAGVAELATQAEVNTGTDDSRIVTALKFATRLAAYAQPLSANLTTLAGVASGAFGRTLLGSADATAAKTSLGLSAIASSGSASDLVTGTIPSAVLPPLVVNETFTPANQVAMLALTAQRGDIAIRQDTGKTYVLSTDNPGTLADWKEIGATGEVQSVAGKTGVVTLVKGDVGLGNVDNTSDLNKPISTATQAALDAKVNTTDMGSHTTDFAAGFVAALA